MRLGLGAIVRAAVLAIGQVAISDRDESSAALAVEYLFADAARLGWRDAGAAQSLFQVHILPMHQTPGARDDVVQRPDGQLIVADSDSRFEGHPVRALKPVSASDGPHGKENVVAVPLLLDLQNALASLSRLRCRVGLADVLMVDAQMRALVDIGFWPRDVCAPFLCGLFQGKQLGLIQAGRVTAAQRPERQAVANIASAVLQVELAHGVSPCMRRPPCPVVASWLGMGYYG